MDDATQIMQQTTNTPGITYNLGQNSTNTIPSITHNQIAKQASAAVTQTMNTQQTQTGGNKQATLPTQLAPKETSAPKQIQDHPPELKEEDDIVYKCKKDAFANTSKFLNTTSNNNRNRNSKNSKNNNNTNNNNNNNNNNNTMEFINKYKIHLLIIIIIIIILCMLGFLIVK